jgi:hypothetical protein
MTGQAQYLLSFLLPSFTSSLSYLELLNNYSSLTQRHQSKPHSKHTETETENKKKKTKNKIRTIMFKTQISSQLTPPYSPLLSSPPFLINPLRNSIRFVPTSNHHSSSYMLFFPPKPAHTSRALITNKPKIPYQMQMIG